ncbi:hypothetical protein RND81_05G002700 [Saponaria officinalis]|uniref:AB hydrolase-1 domain-containing protein n=1 Tax=Saponaria officinalis TaxID=3572 RepID=A0AAW1KT61_SAPOF
MRMMKNKLGLTRLVTQSNILGLEFKFNRFNTKRMVQTVAYEEVRASNAMDKPYQSTAFILHGLLGSARNWRSFARNLSSYLSSNSSSEWRLVLVDLRNHGRSTEVQDLHPPHNLENAAADLANLVKSQGWDWPDVVIGHSLGGKVALQFVQSGSAMGYGDSTALPRQNSCGYWTPYLGLLVLKIVVERWNKFWRHCEVFHQKYLLESGLWTT